MPTVIPLSSGWTLAPVSPGPDMPHSVVAAGAIAATVPGTVHTDLMAAGLLADPYIEDRERFQDWIGTSSWRYTLRFPRPRVEHTVWSLEFDGLDTIAEVRLNGELVGTSANMHLPLACDVSGLLENDNTLEVTFSSVFDAMKAFEAEFGSRPAAYADAFNAVRKAACGFGWDWGARLVTAGIWRPARLVGFSGVRIEAPRLTALPTDGGGRVEAVVPLRWAGASEGTVRIACAGAEASVPVTAGASEATIALDVPGVQLWWPRGLGEARLYDVVIEAEASDGAADLFEARVGFRTVEIDTEEDEIGSPFTFVVNGQPVFARGVNWIPDDCFFPRVTPARYRARLRQTVDANCNLVRVWGGGIYEDDAFYAACDELGLMVWQDFPFACAAYAEEGLAETVEAEVRANVPRLMSHPSLVLWNGCNENIWGHEDWGWIEQLNGKSWGAGFYFDLLPRVVGELDKGRPYWPGSPYSGSRDIHPNDATRGLKHEWDVWNRVDYVHYADERPRFSAEFGYQGPPQYATLSRAVSDKRADSPILALHQKAPLGMSQLISGMAPHLPEPKTFDDWHYLTQLQQAEAVAFGIEHYRSCKPVCMGAVVWQINDCWPVISWAAVDGDGLLKPLWFALRRTFAERLVALRAGDGGLAAHLVNDGASEWSGSMTLERLDVAGAVLAAETVEFAVPPFGALAVAVSDDVATPSEAERELVVATVASADGDSPARSVRPFVADKDMPLVPGRAIGEFTPAAGGVELTITPDRLLRGVIVNADRVDPTAIPRDNVVTILPGETWTTLISTSVPADDERWADPMVIRCVNDVM